MKYALHASLHRPARRPDQTASRPGGKAEEGVTDDSASTEPNSQTAPARLARASFLPPPPTMIHPAGHSSFLSPPPSSVVTTAHDRPTLRFPAVPPPADSLLNSETVSEEEEIASAELSEEIESAEISAQPISAQPIQPISAQPIIDRDRVTEQIAVTEPTHIIDINEPTLEEVPVRMEDFAEEHDDHQLAKPRMVRPRKKGSPPSRHASPVAHTMPEIDPAAWLADEAHARSSDRRDSGDGVDNSDTVVPVPRPTHYV